MRALKRTPLYEKHVELQGKIVDFGGWELPVQYATGVLAEHRKTRADAGLFDVSHMGEIVVRGKGAEAFLQSILSNDVSKIAPKETQYNIMCYENGGCVDDLIVYKYSETDYLLVVNASNADKDFDWIASRAPETLTVENVSEQFAQLAIQGPNAEKILQTLTSCDLSAIRFFHFEADVVVAGKICVVSRTGYTGEDGFEVYCDPADAVELWDAILKAGGDGICPVGLGARDSLRFEAKLPLYGHEISADISPLEARLGFFVKLDKEADFIGKEALKAQKAEGLKRVLCELEPIDRGVPRAGCDVCVGGEKIGFVTTGVPAPTLGKNLALALLPPQYAEPETQVEIMVRDKPIRALVKKGVFYRKKTLAR